MVPRAVLLKSGIVNIARQNFSKTAILVNNAHPKSIVNVARPKSHLSKTAHSTVKRHVQKNTAFKNSNINHKVNTVRSKNVNTARLKAIVNAVMGNKVNVVKASAYYEEIDRGYVAFRGNPKRVKITRKGTIRTGSGPDWLFDIDALTRTINYEPIAAGTLSNSFAGTKACNNVGQARKEKEPIIDYILLPLWTVNPPFSQDPKSSQDDGFQPLSDSEKKVDEDLSKGSECRCNTPKLARS
nr:hypothetical protein [Tanacetum cinerariifolium]